MTQKWVLTVFLVMVIVSSIIVFIYCKWLDKHLELPRDAHVDNKGLTIRNGIKHFKIVNQ